MGDVKRRPTGYVAICRCGRTVGALDAVRMRRSDVGRMLGDWLADGSTVEPRFGEWKQMIESCMCPTEEVRRG